MTKEELQAGREAFARHFGGGREVRVYAAPGRTEIGGNHTDHQHGRVLAAAVDLETWGFAAPGAQGELRLYSEGYGLCAVSLSDLTPRKEEEGTAQGLLRGVASCFPAGTVPGFDLYVTSRVLPGSGLSSSAAFEVLLGTVCADMAGIRRTATEIARMGQMAENRYFGKPCGLMDQMASAWGGLVGMDFRNPEEPAVRPVAFDMDKAGYALCILDVKADHASLTAEYAAIPAEMGAVAAFFGREKLRDVKEEALWAHLPALRKAVGDRAVLRAVHFFEEDRRAAEEAEALASGDLPRFLELVRASGQSSWLYLQNVVPTGAVAQQSMAVALALCGRLLGGEGAWRVHGGGFGGTVQAFVPKKKLPRFQKETEAVFGQGSCHVLRISPLGTRRVE